MYLSLGLLFACMLLYSLEPLPAITTTPALSVETKYLFNCPANSLNLDLPNAKISLRRMKQKPIYNSSPACDSLSIHDRIINDMYTCIHSLHYKYRDEILGDHSYAQTAPFSC